MPAVVTLLHLCVSLDSLQLGFCHLSWNFPWPKATCDPHLTKSNSPFPVLFLHDISWHLRNNFTPSTWSTVLPGLLDHYLPGGPTSQSLAQFCSPLSLSVGITRLTHHRLGSEQLVLHLHHSLNDLIQSHGFKCQLPACDPQMYLSSPDSLLSWRFAPSCPAQFSIWLSDSLDWMCLNLHPSSGQITAILLKASSFIALRPKT